MIRRDRRWERQVPNLPSHSSSWPHSARRIESSIACVIYDDAFQVIAELFSDDSNRLIGG
jgi:hypothetical protein